MRSAVYNRYWATGGGAEKYGGVIAELLASRGPVDLLAHEPFDLAWLSERLRLDLSGCAVRVIEDTPRAFARAAEEADLFVNVSFMSRDPAPHQRSLYVVHFPTALDAHLPGWKRTIARRSGPLRRFLPKVLFEWGDGFHHREPGLRGSLWTDGDASVRVVTEVGRPTVVRFAFGFRRPASAGPAEVRLLVDGVEAARADLEAPPTRAERLAGRAVDVVISSPKPDVPVEITIRSATFVPAELEGGNDVRRLGVPLQSVQIGTGVGATMGRLMPVLLTTALSSSWAETYGTVVSNSSFTQRWVTQRWGVASDVLYPPITLFERGEKEPIILNVGRFFPAGQGHSKRQLELVDAFRSIVDSGHRGWTLHLIGGCSADGEEYLAEVQARAAGYPVVVHANASGGELTDLYRRASIYWHASGLGVDPERDPDVLEHFGISTVEAMSAGAVPVVLGVGGLVETVRHGVDGYHFRTAEGLVAMTTSLIDDPAQLARMSVSAEQQAKRFGVEAFAAQLDEIVDELLARP